VYATAVLGSISTEVWGIIPTTQAPLWVEVPA
jgi:hypothetical protein